MITVHQGETYHYVVVGDRWYVLEPEGSPAFERGCSEHISVARAKKKFGRAYAAYVWAVGQVWGDVPIYYSYSGIINALGQTGEHRPPWRGRGIGDPSPDGVVADLPVIAMIDEADLS